MIFDPDDRPGGYDAVRAQADAEHEHDTEERPHSVNAEEHWYALHDGWVGEH